MVKIYSDKWACLSYMEILWFSIALVKCPSKPWPSPYMLMENKAIAQNSKKTYNANLWRHQCLYQEVADPDAAATLELAPTTREVSLEGLPILHLNYSYPLNEAEGDIINNYCELPKKIKYSSQVAMYHLYHAELQIENKIKASKIWAPLYEATKFYCSL